MACPRTKMPFLDKVESAEVEWAGAQGPVLVAVGVLHGATHVGAEIVEGDDIVVGADSVPSVPSELNDEVVVCLKGVCEVDGLALFKRRRETAIRWLV